jgi:hypothetical protein
MLVVVLGAAEKECSKLGSCWVMHARAWAQAAAAAMMRARACNEKTRFAAVFLPSERSLDFNDNLYFLCY